MRHNFAVATLNKARLGFKQCLVLLVEAFGLGYTTRTDERIKRTEN